MYNRELFNNIPSIQCTFVYNLHGFMSLIEITRTNNNIYINDKVNNICKLNHQTMFKV